MKRPGRTYEKKVLRSCIIHWIEEPRTEESKEGRDE